MDEDRTVDAMKRAVDAMDEAHFAARFFTPLTIGSLQGRAAALRELTAGVIELTGQLELDIGDMRGARCVSNDGMEPSAHLFQASMKLRYAAGASVEALRQIDSSQQALAHLSDV